VLCSFSDAPDAVPQEAVSGVGAQAAGSLFRAYRYAPDYPGLAGKVLTPGKTLEELQRAEAAKK
jgi:hypothetical protein